MPITREQCDERARIVVARDKGRPLNKVKLKSTLKEDLLYTSKEEIGRLKGPLDHEFREFECDSSKPLLKTRTTVRGVGYAAWLGIDSKYKA